MDCRKLVLGVSRAIIGSLPMSQLGSAQASLAERAVAAGIDLARLPAHVAMIMDGNGRWAEERGLPRLMGHREGYRNLRSVLLAASELGIRYLTVYAFSAENWRRPRDEVEGLLSLIEQAARDELLVMHRNNVRVRVAGRIEELPEGLRSALDEGIRATQLNTGITLVLAINYGGRTEIVDAVRKLASEGVPPEKFDEAAIAGRLYNPDIPDPDLMIRTAGEMRWSNFLLWQGAYCELCVSDAPWPEFTPDRLIDALVEYQKRTRKFGGLCSGPAVQGEQE